MVANAIGTPLNGEQEFGYYYDLQAEQRRRTRSALGLAGARNSASAEDDPLLLPHRSAPESACQWSRRAVKVTSCGVLVTDGSRLLLGHATRSSRWDIPKGVAELGEDFASAAARELHEETGLEATPAALVQLGIHRYLPNKDLALFEWRQAAMPDPKTLRCTSRFAFGKTMLPEFDRFGIFDRPNVLSRVGRNMARVLASVWILSD